MQREIRRSIISGKIAAPPSAPAAHRALLAAALSEEQSVISNLPISQNINATAEALNSMGADILLEGSTADVLGAPKLSLPARLDCQESNSTLKLLLPLASLFGTETTVVGAGALAKQPLAPFSLYLERLGATCGSESGNLPLKLCGPIQETELVYPAKLGSAFLSGLLLACPMRDFDTEIGIEGILQQRENQQVAFDKARRCGIEFQLFEEDFIYVSGSQSYGALGDYRVMGSCQLSSHLLLAGALCGRAAISGAPKCPQLEAIFRSFGAVASAAEGQWLSSAGPISGAELDFVSLGSFLPHALVFACLAKGETKISGISALKGRQEKRMRLMVRELSRMGASIKESEGALAITGSKLSGAQLEPEGDAAAAMPLAVAALAASGPSTLSGAECVARAYPGFFSGLSSIGAIIR